MSNDAALLAEIARLSGVIDQRRNTSGQADFASGSRASYRGRGGAAPYRGTNGLRGAYYAAGRGRGGGTGPLPSRHRTLVLNRPADSTVSETTQSKKVSPADLEEGEIDPAGALAAPAQWVKRKTTHNMSLVRGETFEKTEPARLASIAAAQEAKAAAKAARRPALRTKTGVKKRQPAVRRGDKMGEIIIDGVIFQFDETGEKMIKKGPVTQADYVDKEPAAGPSMSTPLNASVDGQKFVRTKNGNLISAEILAQRKANSKKAKLAAMGRSIGDMQKARYASRPSKGKSTAFDRPKGLCSFFNKTGTCKRGLSCQFKHDPEKVAICPGALTAKGCMKPPGTCLLSHNPLSNRVPHCTHYLAGDCRFGVDCFYEHSEKVKPNSAFCSDFSTLGWCARGKECDQRHTWECPEFAEKGSCSRPGCKLAHVIRASTAMANAAQHIEGTISGTSGADAEAAADDDALFMRDDAAATAGDSGMDTDAGSFRKRKHAGDVDGGSDGGESQVLSFVPKTKKSKAFTRQQDFIGFGDDGLDDGMDDGEDSDEDDEHGDEEEDGDHAESVASEDERTDFDSDDDDGQQESGEGSEVNEESESESENDEELAGLTRTAVCSL
ncbi:hypothetical protein K437DRAFT_294569 [Tilletiaria anomala UBC 951]|uniref:C3H1-type domain-containing protein n=1 Tax=Tilletiaria anomala (strain ATCC 24038 / CBS 436.72 / UBC 951) TaxID=1037660 RepID=A0A066VYX2_TILAU|nr:uncharacterized protein K437DRAFT_294569 [Tilletiaria anomala UBC 951]KDN45478.1 hypothetical protein K437DRAFT_294569 [Tilletiaria anomala UBC 951]